MTENIFLRLEGAEFKRRACPAKKSWLLTGKLGMKTIFIGLVLH
jgi:hypothetical protein